MKAFKLIATCIVFFSALPGIANAESKLALTHYEPLQRLQISHGGADKNLTPEFRSATGAGPAGAGPLQMDFDALARSFELQLEVNANLLPAISGTDRAKGVMAYRGHVAGLPDSWVRITLIDGMPAGVIWDGEQLYGVERPGNNLADSDTPIIYRFSDVVIAPGSMTCGAGPSPANGAAFYKALVSELGSAAAQAPGAVNEINIGAIGDFEFTNPRGANAAAEMIARLNIVDVIFSEQLGVQINVTEVETFADINDPFTNTTVSDDLLDELVVYRGNTPAQNSLGLTHLWTGRDLDGTTVGIAFTGALCSIDFGAGLSEANRGTNFDALIAAHEIGHNFGAPHDGVSDSACESEPSTFLMATNLNGNDQFSACSIAEMQDDIAAAMQNQFRAPACISALPSVDMAVTEDNQSQTALLGNSATVSFDITNNGTLQASGVVADFTIPNNVSLLSAAATSGNCSSGAGTVSCTLGNVAGRSSIGVTISTTATTVGVGTFTGTVTSDVDDNGTNNQNSIQVTVDPAVNLVVNTPSSAQINVDQSTSVSATLQNQANLDATGVTLSVSLDSGLRADSASWSIGSCTVAARQVDCTAASFGAQSSSTLDLGITALASGTQNYTVSLASTEADTNSANNSVSGTVTVNSPSGGGDDDGGGGSSGPVFLMLLGSVAALRRRRAVCHSEG